MQIDLGECYRSIPYIWGQAHVLHVQRAPRGNEKAAPQPKRLGLRPPNLVCSYISMSAIHRWHTQWRNALSWRGALSCLAHGNGRESECTILEPSQLCNPVGLPLVQNRTTEGNAESIGFGWEISYRGLELKMSVCLFVCLSVCLSLCLFVSSLQPTILMQCRSNFQTSFVFA